MSEITKVIWIPSYPKSGNTWVHSVLKASGKKCGFPQVDLDVYNLLKSGNKPEVCPIIKKSISQSDSAVLKTHVQYSENMHDELELNPIAFCHIIRNPLDVLLSFINFTRIQYATRKNDHNFKRNLFIELLGFDNIVAFDKWQNMTLDSLPRKNLDNALTYFSENDGSIPNFMNMSGTWFAHAVSWREAGSKLPGISLRYEDLIDDKNEFLKLSSIFELTDQDILEGLTIINNKQKTARKDPNKPRAKIFYNKMSSYYYMDYFSQSCILNFLDRHSEKLQKLGYGNMPS
jgi:hypothetical protein